MPRDWLIPLQSRRISSREHVNFLFCQDDCVYISDNHRTAAWCWLQRLRPNEPVALFHIDRHSDTLQSGLAQRLEELPPLPGLSLNEYLNAGSDASGSGTPLIHWGNYLSLFLARHGEMVELLYWAQLPPTGDPPHFSPCEDVPPHELPLHLDACAQNERPTIVNLDLDYFMWRRARNDYYAIYSDAYLHHLGSSIAHLREAGVLRCLTIALSPECCGGWENSERLLEKLSQAMKWDLTLSGASLAPEST